VNDFFTQINAEVNVKNLRFEAIGTYETWDTELLAFKCTEYLNQVTRAFEAFSDNWVAIFDFDLMQKSFKSEEEKYQSKLNHLNKQLHIQGGCVTASNYVMTLLAKITKAETMKKDETRLGDAIQTKLSYQMHGEPLKSVPIKGLPGAEIVTELTKTGIGQNIGAAICHLERYIGIFNFKDSRHSFEVGSWNASRQHSIDVEESNRLQQEIDQCNLQINELAAKKAAYLRLKENQYTGLKPKNEALVKRSAHYLRLLQLWYDKLFEGLHHRFVRIPFTKIEIISDVGDFGYQALNDLIIQNDEIQEFIESHMFNTDVVRSSYPVTAKDQEIYVKAPEEDAFIRPSLEGVYLVTANRKLANTTVNCVIQNTGQDKVASLPVQSDILELETALSPRYLQGFNGQFQIKIIDAIESDDAELKLVVEHRVSA
jgi:hypothetical protein